MGQKTKGGMFCSNCNKPVMGVKNTHRLRNTASVVALPATNALSLVGLKSEHYVCPTCGSKVQQKMGGHSTAGSPHRADLQRAEDERRSQVEAGAWWLEMGAFRGQKPKMHTLYLGGWPAYSTTHVGKNTKTLILDSKGVRLQSVVKALLTIPWAEVASLSTEDAASSGRSSVVAEMTSEGHKKREKETVFIVRTTKGEEVLFILPGVTSEECQGTLAPVMKRMNAAAARPGKTNAVVPPETATGIADELAKLALLRDSGALSDEEFAAAKARVLGDQNPEPSAEQ